MTEIADLKVPKKNSFKTRCNFLINFLFSKNTFLSLLSGIVFAGLFSFVFFSFAQPFLPGETTNHSCPPTDSTNAVQSLSGNSAISTDNQYLIDNTTSSSADQVVQPFVENLVQGTASYLANPINDLAHKTMDATSKLIVQFIQFILKKSFGSPQASLIRGTNSQMKEFSLLAKGIVNPIENYFQYQK